MSKIIGDPHGDFYLGQRIKIIDGPWIEFTGVIAGIDQIKKKVVVKINFWGKDTPVELNSAQIEPLSLVFGKNTQKKASFGMKCVCETT
jgi:hypothetical protein